MLKSDMICETCIYSHPIISDGEVGKNSLTCRRHTNTSVKAKGAWCGEGEWIVWHENEGPDDVVSQWVYYAWGDWEKEESK